MTVDAKRGASMNRVRIALSTLALGLCCSCAVMQGFDPLRAVPGVTPVSEDVSLVLDAWKTNYAGSVSIALRVEGTVREVRFHARDMDLQSVRLETPDGTIGLEHAVGEKGTVTARLPSPLGPGDYTLEVAFANDFETRGTGIYRTEQAGEAYLFTQFQPEFARLAFPCFDEPHFKIPWQLTLVVPAGHLAVSNTPVEEESSSGETRTIRFRRTEPLPSYLVALAIGPLETTPVPNMSIPSRIVTAKGKRHLTGEAVSLTPRLLKALEDYFGSPYPYRKLDQLAVPEFNFGAMENVGAITYRDTILLRDPGSLTTAQKQRLSSVMAHEMAHMWFGNLVTPKWWDDLWLNESFASWLALKMVNRVYPELDMSNRDISTRQWAMANDALPSTMAIRRHVPSDANMTGLMDRALAYTLAGPVKPHQLGNIPFGMADAHYKNRRRVFAWLVENYDRVKPRMPEQSLPYLPWLSAGNSPDLIGETRAFLLDTERIVPGIEKEMDEAEDVVTHRVRLNRKEKQALVEYLR